MTIMNKSEPYITNIKLILALALSTLTATVIAENPATDYRNNTLYFIVTDRFNMQGAPYIDPMYPDANSNLNCFQVPCNEERQWRSYWGGNIEGIIQKLDYLHDLGISGIWVTPLMENVPGYDPNGWGSGYHGYWVDNIFRVNPYFGNWNDVDALSNHLHSYGMRYMQDITLNHSNPSDSHIHGRLYYSTGSGQVLVDSYQTDALTPNKNNQFYKHYEDDDRCKDAATKPDSAWTYWQLHHCLLAKLSGYNQQNPQTADYLNNGYQLWMNHGVDDLRLDVVKFVDPDFLANFTHQVTNNTAAAGRPVPYIVGEWSDGGVGDEKSLHFANSYNHYLTNILDFQLSFALNRFIGGNYEAASQQMNATQLGHFLDERVVAFKGRDTWQGTFLDNHDQVRTMVRLEKLHVTDETERRQRMDLATVLLMTVRGIPIIFYGDEQYLAHYDDKHNIPPEYINSGNDDPYNRIGMTKWSQDTSAYKIIKTLAELRKTSPAIARGDYRTLYADQDVLVFLRTYKNDRVLVAINRGNSKNITLKEPLNLAAGHYNNLLQNTSTASQNNGFQILNNNVSLHLNRLSATVIHF